MRYRRRSFSRRRRSFRGRRRYSVRSPRIGYRM